MSDRIKSTASLKQRVKKIVELELTQEISLCIHIHYPDGSLSTLTFLFNMHVDKMQNIFPVSKL
jgi:hypothetical protein